MTVGKRHINDSNGYTIEWTDYGYPYEFIARKDGLAVADDTYQFRALHPQDIAWSTGKLKHYETGERVPNFLVNLRSEWHERTVAIEERQ